MAIDVKVPEVGESIQEGMIESWSKSDGDFVEKDEVILELETDKATVEIASEASGVLTILVEAGKVVKVGDVIAKIEEKAGQSETVKAAKSVAENNSQPTSNQNSSFNHGPAVKHIIDQDPNLNLSQIKGSGRGGRVTKEDILSQAAVSDQIQVRENNKIPSSEPSSLGSATAKVKNEGEGRIASRKPMSMLRRKVSERLLHAQSEAAILTTFNEVDMSAVMNLRSRYKDKFQEIHGIKLGFMGFFLKASTAALEAFPLVNSYIEGTDIVSHNFCDIGVAVSTKKGLMVPVIRDVDKMTLAQVEGSLNQYAVKARENKISLDDLSGGTFTVSNGGVFGSLLSTPILNPPQSAILGMHKIQNRPMVMEDGSISARPMMYLALSYDHRIIDGKEAVGFLVKIKEILEDPARLVLGV